MARGLKAKSVAKMSRAARVNLPGAVEKIWQPFYDYQTLPAAGASALTFFQEPIGQNSKTLSDTNMELSGQVPKGQRFAITGVQVELYPGVDIDGAAVTDFSNDVYDVLKGGHLILRIGSKEYIRQGNLMKFPPVNSLTIDASTGLVTQQIQYATGDGREFSVVDLLLESNQNFSVELRDLSALPSGQDAKIGVTLNGFLYRNAQ